MGWSLLKILHANCDPKMADDKSLPYTSYLVHYVDGNDPKYDLVIASINRIYTHLKTNINPLFSFVIDGNNKIYWSLDD